MCPLSVTRWRTVRSRVRSGALHSAHDIAEGGIAVALAECCLAGGDRRARDAARTGLDPFGEDLGSGFIVSGPAAALEGLRVIGEVGGDALELAGLFRVETAEMAAAHAGGLPGLLA